MPDARDVLYDSTTPQFYVGGRERFELGRDVMALEVEEDISGLKRLCFSLGAIGPQRGDRDEQLLYLDGEILYFGSSLDVAVGPRSAARTVFSGKVSGIELEMQQGRDPEVRVFAEDRLMDLRMTRRFKTYENSSDADVARDVAGRNGLSAAIDVDGPTYKSVQQWNQTDLAFLRDRAHRLSAELWLEGETLHMATRDKRAAAAGRVTLIQGNDLLALQVRADLAHQRTKQHVSGFDAAAKDSIDEDAESDVAAAEATDGRLGLDVLSQAFGERVTYRVRDVPFVDAEARAWARAALLARARRFVVVHGITLGTPTLTVGTTVKLERIGAAFEGDGYYVTRVAHVYDTKEGLRTHFDAERAWIGKPS
jgi:phage protein D